MKNIKMNAVQQTIRILVVILLVECALAQDGYSERDMLRFQQMAADSQLYSANIVRDPAGQPTSVNLYHVTDDTNNDDYHRADRTRTRKVYRIKNPFQNQLEDNRQDGTVDSRDSSTGASNQYASMQYSLPPDEFLQQIRAESQFYQQSTPAPNLGYTATPQPQYQYSTIAPQNYDSVSQANQVQVPQLEAKSHTQYLTNAYQYNPPNSFPYDGLQSTPSPGTPFISTALPSGQFVSTPSNSYVSSASSIFLSSPTNLQYVSSPLSPVQTGSPDYGNNRVTTTIGNNVLSYDSNEQNKKLQIDHYDNSANGIRYPINVQRQYQNEYPSSTVSPASTPDPRDQWQNNINTVTAAPKSLHDVTYTQYQNYPYSEQDHSRNNNDHVNTETHRIGNLHSNNNIYMNYMQPEYQNQNNQNNARARTRDLEQQIGQPDYYSNGEYGWKVEDKKPLVNNNDAYSSGGYRYQTVGLQSDNGEAVSQMNFHMDTSKQYTNYDQAAKSSSESIHAQEFAKAAARAHENMKQQNLYENNYDNNNNYNIINNNPNSSPNGSPFYNNYEKQKSKYESAHQNNYYNQQQDLITASPYFYNRDNGIDNKPKPTFDHAKALKNIVPIDVSNVVSDSQKGTSNDGNNRFAIQNYDRDALDRQQYRQLTDAYFKDKNAIYGYNIKTKPDEYQGSDGPKLFDPNPSYYGKQQQAQEPTYNQGAFAGPQRLSYVSQGSNNIQDSIQSSANIQQQGLLRPTQQPTDINGIFKLNDLPYHLTQNVSPDALKFSNLNFDRGNIPSPLPIRLNQDVTTHQLDVTSNLLSKLMKQPGFSLNRPDLDSQAGSLVSTINGFKVANPYNVDMKLVADVLKGKSSVDEHLLFRDQYSKPSPLKFDLAQLQLLLKNDNMGLSPISDQLSVLSSPFLEIYNGGRPSYPYQKYSRSQEEEEPLVPIADASSNHPIGAVMEQDDPTSEREGSTGPDENAINEGSISHDDERPKKPFHSHRSIIDRHRHPNALISGRYQRRYPKSEVDEPYPLLKPPPPHSVRGRGSHIKHNRRRRLNKSPKILRIMKAEPLFEADTEDASYESHMPVLRPPAPVIESKSDTVVEDNNENSS